MSERASERTIVYLIWVTHSCFCERNGREGRKYIKKIMSKLDEKRGLEIRSRGEEYHSLGVLRQDRASYLTMETFYRKHIMDNR